MKQSMEQSITQKNFLKKYNLEEEFMAAGISWDELMKIYEDFISEPRQKKLAEIMNQFIGEYIIDLGECGLHSYHGRVKDAEHLIAKIIRKKVKNYRKYKEIDLENYPRIITDLIGVRGLLLFKEEWIKFHEYLLGRIENDGTLYIEDNCLSLFDKDENHCYIAEPPKVHMRAGDNKEIYRGIISEDHIYFKQNYRSVHYIIKYKGFYIEMQVRTLFEEGWSEIDHRLRYPYYEENPLLKDYTALLSRLVGLADEMGTFFNILPEHAKESEFGSIKEGKQKPSRNILEKAPENMKSAAQCVESILFN